MNDVGIDRPGGNNGISPRLVQHDISGQHLSFMLDKKLEEIEF
jgi:hypothetical protein